MDVDVSLRRQFSITERVKLAVQADAFNLNTAVHFGAPATNPDQASFGTVSSQAKSAEQAAIHLANCILKRAGH